jgi:hypothetical protein
MASKKLLTAAAAVAAMIFAAGAAADHGGRGDHHGHGHGRGHAILLAHLAGSVPSDPPIHGVLAGNVPWDGGARATLNGRGRFELRVRGLVITGMGNPGPVTSVSASLFCAPDSDTTPAFTTGSVPLSAHGNARIRAHVTVPDRCLAPVLLVHPNGGTARYIAASGFMN